MKLLGVLLVALASVPLLAGCVSFAEDVDKDLSLPEAKKYTQRVEREVADALPTDLVLRVDQKETGVFLPCSRDGGQQWAGGLTAEMQPGAGATEVLDPVAAQIATIDDLAVNRREDDEDSIVEIVGRHHSAWVVRYDRETGELNVTSFSPCIYLPDDVWRGDTY